MPEVNSGKKRSVAKKTYKLPSLKPSWQISCLKQHRQPCEPETPEQDMESLVGAAFANVGVTIINAITKRSSLALSRLVEKQALILNRDSQK